MPPCGQKTYCYIKWFYFIQVKKLKKKTVLTNWIKTKQSLTKTKQNRKSIWKSETVTFFVVEIKWFCSYSIPMLQVKPPLPSLSFPVLLACCRVVQAPAQRRHPPSMDASGQAGVRDGLSGVTGEGHGDGVARPPRHLLHAMEVLWARGEERHSSCKKGTKGTL